jgi:hypothetical protein
VKHWYREGNLPFLCIVIILFELLWATPRLKIFFLVEFYLFIHLFIFMTILGFELRELSSHLLGRHSYHLSPFLFICFLDSISHILPRLASGCHPPDLRLLSIWNYSLCPHTQLEFSKFMMPGLRISGYKYLSWTFFLSLRISLGFLLINRKKYILYLILYIT